MRTRAGALAAVVVAWPLWGCAKSDFQLARHEKSFWAKVDQRKLANAPAAPPPKILPETYLAAGRLFESQGALGKAIDQFRKAVAANHNYAEAHHCLGLALSRAGAHDEAVSALQAAVKLQANNPVFHNDLGFELIFLKRWEQAVTELTRATELAPGFARAHINLGMALSRLGRDEEALASFRVVLPEGDALYNLGLMYRGQRRYSDAIRVFRRAREADPTLVAASWQLKELAAYAAGAPTGIEAMAEAPVPTEGTSSRGAETRPLPSAPSPAARADVVLPLRAEGSASTSAGGAEVPTADTAKGTVTTLDGDIADRPCAEQLTALLEETLVGEENFWTGSDSVGVDGFGTASIAAISMDEIAGSDPQISFLEGRDAVSRLEEGDPGVGQVSAISNSFTSGSLAVSFVGQAPDNTFQGQAGGAPATVNRAVTLDFLESRLAELRAEIECLEETGEQAARMTEALAAAERRSEPTLLHPTLAWLTPSVPLTVPDVAAPADVRSRHTSPRPTAAMSIEPGSQDASSTTAEPDVSRKGSSAAPAPQTWSAFERDAPRLAEDVETIMLPMVESATAAGPLSDSNTAQSAKPILVRDVWYGPSGSLARIDPTVEPAVLDLWPAEEAFNWAGEVRETSETLSILVNEIRCQMESWGYEELAVEGDDPSLTGRTELALTEKTSFASADDIAMVRRGTLPPDVTLDAVLEGLGGGATLETPIGLIPPVDSIPLAGPTCPTQEPIASHAGDLAAN